MEVSRHGLLEELIAPLNTDELFPNGWISTSFESSGHQPAEFLPSNSSLEAKEPPLTPQDSVFACPLADIFKKPHTPPLPPPPPSFPVQDHDCDSMVEEPHSREVWQLLVNGFEGAKIRYSTAKEEEMMKKKKCKVKKADGQPSKNLMAERRRRKRLNDRLSMLRSIVPKISKVFLVLN